MVYSKPLLACVVFSVGLHCFSLMWDISLPIAHHATNAVGIGYVSRSLEDFQPTLMNAPGELVKQADDQHEQHVQQHLTKMQIDDPVRNVDSESKKKPELGQFQAVSDTQVEREELRSELSQPASKIVKNTTKPDALIPSANIEQPEKRVTPSSDPSLTEDKRVHSQEHRAPKIADRMVEAAVPRPSRTGETGLEAVSPVGVAQMAVPDSTTVGQNQPPNQSALPRYDRNPRPQYPRIAKLRGWEGEVLFEVLVLKNGRVGELKLLTSSGYKSLDDAAKKALVRWLFQPAIESGLPIDSHVRVPIKFSLRTL